MKLAMLRLPDNLGDIYFPSSRFITNNSPVDPVDIVRAIISWSLDFAGAFAVLAIVYSGVMYITAGDNADKAASAKKNIIWAVMGLIVILGANLLVSSVADLITGNLASQNQTNSASNTPTVITLPDGSTTTMPDTNTSNNPNTTTPGANTGSINIGLPQSEINLPGVSVDLPSATVHIPIPNAPNVPFSNVNINL